MTYQLSKARVLAALQTPINAAAFGDKIGTAAWHVKPSFILTKNDHALAHEVQQRFAKQINARTKELANWLIAIANLI